MALLKTQKNELFEIWQNSGLNPDDFEIRDTDTHNQSAAVIHKKEQWYYFRFDRVVLRPTKHAFGPVNNSYFNIEYSPGEQIVHEKERVGDNWESIIHNYIEWIKNVIRERKQPNLWEEFLKNKVQLAPIEDDDNSKFSEAEKEKITSQINVLRTRLKSVEHTKEQLDYANKKLDYLCDRVQHLGKTDWKNIAVSTLLIIYQMFATNPEMINQIIKYYTELFPFLMHIPKLLGHD